MFLNHLAPAVLVLTDTDELPVSFSMPMGSLQWLTKAERGRAQARFISQVLSPTLQRELAKVFPRVEPNAPQPPFRPSHPSLRSDVACFACGND